MECKYSQIQDIVEEKYARWSEIDSKVDDESFQNLVKKQHFCNSWVVFTCRSTKYPNPIH